MDAHNPNRIRRELESEAAVREHLASPGATWHEVVVQNVDLRPVDDALGRQDLAGCQFLGCTLGPTVAEAVARSEREEDPHRQCLVFPPMPWLPFNPYRSTLYRAEELLGDFAPALAAARAATPEDALEAARAGYAASVDWRTYLTFADPRDNRPFGNDSVDTVLARRLHDTAVADALADLLAPIRAGQPGAKRGIVAIMGGHDMPRREKLSGPPPSADPGGARRPRTAEPVDDDAGWEGMADDAVYTRVALIAWKLAREGYLLVSGGGPGAMEATNLGAYFATRPIAALRAAIRTLEAVPKLVYGEPAAWLLPAMLVRRDHPLRPDDAATCQSVGIPTWVYGHEPPNPFATHIAKYFENSVREEGLLAIATHGVLFAPGNAGTVQEIFQDACQNYYGTYGTAAPMILFGSDYWNPPAMPSPPSDRRKQVYPLLYKLAAEKGFTDRVVVTDAAREVLQVITAYSPGR
jgi:predicted Rossmann-fold nucleotide-binding protein